MLLQSQLEEAYLICDQIARQRARNFYPAFRFLPKNRRLALAAFYAFCTFSDDVSDDSHALKLGERRRKLTDWREALDRCFSGHADTPVFIALEDSCRRFDLPKQPFYDLLEGIEMDLQLQRYATFSDLKGYCRKVASSVGKVSVKIFGCTNPGADVYADNLGIAFQLTNILRDLTEDISVNRLYLPLEDLDRFEYREDDMYRGRHDHRFMNLMQFEYERTWSYYQAADPSLAGDQKRLLFPAQIMKAVYWRLLHELKRHDFQVLKKRISIPWWRKVSALAAASLQRLA